MDERLNEAREAIRRVDAEMAELFRQRMAAAKQVAAYKKDHGLPILDAAQEQRVLERCLPLVPEPELRDDYTQFVQGLMDLSKRYQRQLTEDRREACAAVERGERNSAVIPVSPGHDPYDIVLERGCLRRAGDLLNLNRRVLIVTDENIPEAYVRAVSDACARPSVVTVPPGEGSKDFSTLQRLLERMLAEGFTRGDCVVSVGGGMVGDLAGFAASMYMRGVDAYNIPTTVLSQVDASVGGKTAINLGGVKNVVGAFYQPRRVLIDPDTTATLPRRQIASGLAEALKTGLIADEELFAIFEQGEAEQRLDEVIARSVTVKSAVVSKDEKEQGLRRILNFGHTLGHGIEALHGLHHGECVALGMLPMCAPAVRARLEPVLEKLGLPTALDFDPEAVMAAVVHDKKSVEGGITCVLVDEVGACRLEKRTPAQLRAALETIRRQ